jgi:RNA-binding protein 8A
MNEAQEAIKNLDNTKLLDQTIGVDFAFVRPPPGKGGQQGRSAGGRGGRGGGRNRSASPGERDDRRASYRRDDRDYDD